MKNNYTIIIPVHEFNDNVKKYLTISLKSVDNQKKIKYKPSVLIVSSVRAFDGINKFISETEFPKINLEIIKNEGDSSFQGQMNFASKYITTKYFMFLEFDDELNENYLYRSDKYLMEMGDIGIFLNILINVNEDNKPINLTNEMAWSRQFNDKTSDLGFLNVEQLIQFSDFSISGAFINTKIFKNVGMLKTKIELSFVYEFLLRVLNSGYKIFVIPKIGCKHVKDRDGSLFKNYMINMSVVDRKFWFETAKKEYFFNNDRDIVKEV
mgnify:CR=1 FL=1